MYCCPCIPAIAISLHKEEVVVQDASAISACSACSEVILLLDLATSIRRFCFDYGCLNYSCLLHGPKDRESRENVHKWPLQENLSHLGLQFQCCHAVETVFRLRSQYILQSQRSVLLCKVYLYFADIPELPPEICSPRLDLSKLGSWWCPGHSRTTLWVQEAEGALHWVRLLETVVNLSDFFMLCTSSPRSDKVAQAHSTYTYLHAKPSQRSMHLTKIQSARDLACWALRSAPIVQVMPWICSRGTNRKVCSHCLLLGGARISPLYNCDVSTGKLCRSWQSPLSPKDTNLSCLLLSIFLGNNTVPWETKQPHCQERNSKLWWPGISFHSNVA